MYAHAWGGAFGWLAQTMLANSIATMLLVPVIWLLCRLLQRRPTVQHLLWLLLLVKFMTPQVPGFAWVIPESIAVYQWQQEFPSHQDRLTFAEESNVSPSDQIAQPLDSVTFSESSGEAKLLDSMAISPQPIMAISPIHLSATILFSAWVFGAGYFLVSIALGLRKQSRILKRSSTPSQRFLQIVNEVAGGLGLRKLASVISPDIRSPFVSCLGYVRLVWPNSLSAAEPTSLRSLMAHEAAHVRRRDHYVSWLELIATILWWWNPIFWFVRHRLRVSAEIACDAIALDAFPDDRCMYAEKLLELSACLKTGAPPLVLAVGGGTPSSIERRIAMIVSDRVSCKVSIWGLLLIAAIGLTILPSWTFGQNAATPPAPEPVSWLLDPFMQRVPPAAQPTPIQPLPNAPASVAFNNQEKLLLRLKAMYLVALSENRTTDAEALAAAIFAIAQANATEGKEVSERLDGTKGILGGVSRVDNADQSDIVYSFANGNVNIPDLTYAKKVIRDHLPLRIKVTGNYNGPVWGSNPYTDDSSLSTAAIHAGLVKPGQTAEIVLIRRPGKESYSGSQSHGVTALDYGPWAGSFELAPVSQYLDAPYLCDRSALRGNTDACLTLNMLAGQAPLKPGVSLIVPLDGKAGAPIVGTDDYASDCNLDAAAVHAGVLKLGESAYVKLLLAEGLESYAGSKRNGVESFPYGKTNMSLRFEVVPTTVSRDLLRSPSAQGGATGALGELGGPTDGGASALNADQIGGIPELGAPSVPVEQQIQQDPRADRVRELGPRRSWEYEKFNLHRSHSLGQFRAYAGLAVRIRVTGEKDGLVWGSNPYSDDSSLHSAALHSGLVVDGETADVVAIIRPGQPSYAGSESHGIASHDFGPYPGSFELVPVSQHPDAPYLCDRSVLLNSSDNYLSLNKLAGQVRLDPGVSLIVPLHAKAGAPIIGADQYASDCNLDATAIHAGVLKEGESGYVKIILAEGLDSYVGLKRNGVESYPYGKTKLSIRFEKLQAQPTNPNSSTSYNDRNLKSLEFITYGVGTVAVNEALLRALDATTDAYPAKPKLGDPSEPNKPYDKE